MQPKISIIIPVYNAEEEIQRCLISVQQQTYENIEVLVINDGSTDQSGELCESFSIKDSRFRVFHQENKGVSAARNKGLENATGEYIGFVDSDDWIEPNMFEILWQTLEDTMTEIAICGYCIHHQEEWVEEYSFPFLPIIMDGMTALEYTLHPSLFRGYLVNKLFMRQKIEHMAEGSPLRFDTTIHMTEDLLFCCQYLLSVEKVSYTPKVLYHYILREGSATKSYGEKRRTELLAREKLIELLCPVSDALCRKVKTSYVEASINLVRFAARDGEKELLPILQKEVQKYLPEYRNSEEVSFKSKFRTWIIMKFPILSDKIWSFLKPVLRITWERKPKSKEEI